MHHKAVGHKESVAATTAAATGATKALAPVESIQQLKEQFGLELAAAADKKEDKRKQRHDKWISSKSLLVSFFVHLLLED